MVKKIHYESVYICNIKSILNIDYVDSEISSIKQQI